MSNSETIDTQHTENRNWLNKLDDHRKEIKLVLGLLGNVASRTKREDSQILVGKFQGLLNNCLKSLDEIAHQFKGISPQSEVKEHSPTILQEAKFRENEEMVAEILEKVLEELRTELSDFRSE